MTILTILNFIMILSLVYLIFSKKKSTNYIYFIPVIYSITRIVYTIIENPNPLSGSMIIGGIAGATLLSLELCLIFYVLNKMLVRKWQCIFF